MSDHTWICTHTGRRFYPLEPRVEDICIEDIAHALSHICRFTGHVETFYSVAEHCWRASLIAPMYLKLPMLLHDASEAYLCDVSRPVKHAHGMEFYRGAEHKLMRVIGEKFGVEFSDELIHEIDNRMLMTERRDLMPQSQPWTVGADPYRDIIVPVPPKTAKLGFHQQFLDLTT